jgi:phage baseplate assembly protein W
VKTLALSGGDLVIGPGGLQLISGAAKIRQDLSLGMAEEYGTDPYHPLWGSVLPRYIGQPVDADTQLLVRAEVNRIIQQYMANQQAQISSASTNGRGITLTTADIIRSVDRIDVTVSYDTVRIMVYLTTMASQTISVSRTVTQ